MYQWRLSSEQVLPLHYRYEIPIKWDDTCIISVCTYIEYIRHGNVYRYCNIQYININNTPELYYLLHDYTTHLLALLLTVQFYCLLPNFDTYPRPYYLLVPRLYYSFVIITTYYSVLLIAAQLCYLPSTILLTNYTTHFEDTLLTHIFWCITLVAWRNKVRLGVLGCFLIYCCWCGFARFSIIRCQVDYNVAFFFFGHSLKQVTIDVRHTNTWQLQYQPVESYSPLRMSHRAT